MGELAKATLLGLFFGTFGTTLGGIIGITFKSTSKKFLSFILALASGLMMAIICFDLIPEALEISNMSNTLVGILLGIIVMIFCNLIVEKRIKVKSIQNNAMNTILKTGIIVSLGIAIHNFPEGLAIGICLSFAAGAMLYIVSGELTPEANNLYKGKMTAIGNILEILLGIFATLN